MQRIDLDELERDVGDGVGVDVCSDVWLDAVGEPKRGYPISYSTVCFSFTIFDEMRVQRVRFYPRDRKERCMISIIYYERCQALNHLQCLIVQAYGALPLRVHCPGRVLSVVLLFVYIFVV